MVHFTHTGDFGREYEVVAVVIKVELCRAHTAGVAKVDPRQVQCSRSLLCFALCAANIQDAGTAFSHCQPD